MTSVLSPFLLPTHICLPELACAFGGLIPLQTFINPVHCDSLIGNTLILEVPPSADAVRPSFDCSHCHMPCVSNVTFYHPESCVYIPHPHLGCNLGHAFLQTGPYTPFQTQPSLTFLLCACPLLKPSIGCNTCSYHHC